MSERFERIMSAVLVIAAVAVTGSVVRREFFSPREGLSRVDGRDTRAPEFVKTWRDVARLGVPMGDSAAPVQILEFTDLECPFCKRYSESTLAATQREFGNRVAVTFVHFPLPMHRFAGIAARAAECAATQGKFAAFVREVFAHQDSLGFRRWNAFALAAGIPDTIRFGACVAETARLARVDSGTAVGARLGVRGTPTIVVNGWLYHTPPSDTTLSRAITSLLQGQVPGR